MRRLALAALLGMALAGPAAAQDGDREQRLVAARELVEAIGTRGTVETILVRLRETMIAGVRQQAPRLDPAQVASIVDDYLMPEFRARSGEVAEASAVSYAGRLSVDEIHALVAFYRTPLGAKLLAITPEIGVESIRFGREWGARVAQAAFAKHREALRARGLNL